MFRWFEKVGYIANFAELKRDFSKLSGFESYLRDRNWTKPTATGVEMKVAAT